VFFFFFLREKSQHEYEPVLWFKKDTYTVPHTNPLKFLKKKKKKKHGETRFFFFFFPIIILCFIES